MQARELLQELELGFKFNRNPKHKGLPELDGSVCSLQEDVTGRSRDIL